MDLILKPLMWPARRLKEGYRFGDLPSLGFARLRGIIPRDWEERLNARETEAQVEVMRTTPRTLFLEVTGRCPIECLMCARRYRDWKYGDLSPAIFERLSDIFPRVGTVVIGGFGEPLVANNFDQYFERLSRLGARVALQTSGYRLTEDRARRLFEGGLAHLHISMDSPNEETYTSIRPRISFSDVRSRIEQIVRLKREATRSEPSIHVVFVAMRRNIEQLPDMVDFVSEMGADNLTVQYMVVHSEDVRDESLFYHKDLTNRLLDDAQRRAEEIELNVTLPPRFGQSSPRPAGRCTDPWKVAFVRWNGEVRPCCYAPSTWMGNLAGDSFWRIWNGPAYQDLRRRVNSGDPPAFCRICTAGRMRGIDDEGAHIVLGEVDSESESTQM